MTIDLGGGAGSSCCVLLCLHAYMGGLLVLFLNLSDFVCFMRRNCHIHYGRCREGVLIKIHYTHLPKARVLEKFHPPKLEDPGLENCALLPDYIKQTLLKDAATA